MFLMQMKTDNQTSNQLLGGGLLFVLVEVVASEQGYTYCCQLSCWPMMIIFSQPFQNSRLRSARAAPWLYVHVPTRIVFQQILVVDPVITTAHVNQMRVLWGVY